MSNAKILATHVGMPAELQYNKRRVLSAINKQPVTGAVIVHRLNIEGDEQADLKVHGGANKAVYCYPSEHYRLGLRISAVRSSLVSSAKTLRSPDC